MLGLGLNIFGRAPQGTAPGFDVFLIAGQSNNLAGTGLDTEIDVSHPDVFQWGREAPNNNVIILADEPLDHVVLEAGKIGYALAMIRDYYIPNAHLAAVRDVLLIPTALSASGFADNRWNAGDDLYEDAVLRVNTAIDGNPGSVLKGILWHQGEDDVGSATYLDALDAMIAAMRSDIVAASATTPFILGGMVPFWVDAATDRRVQQGRIHGTLKRLTYTGFADPELPTVIEKAVPATDSTHYDAPTQRELAERYYNAWLAAQSNDDISAPSYSFDTDLVGYWRFETGSFEDRAGSNDPTVTGSPVLTFDTTYNEIVYSADGGDYLETSLQLPNSYTKSIWVKMNAGGGSRNIMSSKTGAADQHFLYHDSSAAHFAAGHQNNFTQIVSSFSPSNDTWYHLAVTYDEASSTLTLYIDGSEEDQVTDATVGGSGFRDVAMATISGGSTFTGELRHARIYDRALTAAEVLEVYNTENG
ncbi:hypothetical protein MnTg02_02615 [bacterium MnTg02]|nr:hypothetical protein MnTg02_02615 [bacterium MnTg02]